MVMVESTMLALGTLAPDFSLPEVVSGRQISLADFADAPALLVIFLCQHCPFVKHIQTELAQLGQTYTDLGVGIVAISANDVVAHPQDSPEQLKAMAETLGFTFPICYDETQQTAKRYTAACTPDFFLFDQAQQLVYRGRFDDSRPNGRVPVTGQALRSALDAVLAGQPMAAEQKPSIGCNIKWKPGNAPAYFGPAMS